MKKSRISILSLVAVLLLAACNPGKAVFTVDGTKPVSLDANTPIDLDAKGFAVYVKQ